MTANYIPSIPLSDFTYDLPVDRIALYPLEERDMSRLLVCNIGRKTIEHHSFTDLPDLIPSNALLFLNSTRVVRARVVMNRESGGRVEIFLLEPITPSKDPAVALSAQGETTWLCMVGGARKLARDGQLHGEYADEDGQIALSAMLIAEHEDGYVIRFRWSPERLSFAELLEVVGRIPLPPYIKRDSVESDTATYQTVYATERGAVAAPTAGLHFTPRLLEDLRTRGVKTIPVTLHVGAGTFRQVKGEVSDHRMHSEQIAISLEMLRGLLEHAIHRRESGGYPLIPVGTTSLRMVESLYWFGARLFVGEGSEGGELVVDQWDPYRLEKMHHNGLPDLVQSLEKVVDWAGDRDLPAVAGRTGLMILPGYEFRACDALITNFHQPDSTLILLVGAFLGRDLWRNVYDEALREGYRFLSYGDASLLMR